MDGPISHLTVVRYRYYIDLFILKDTILIHTSFYSVFYYTVSALIINADTDTKYVRYMSDFEHKQVDGSAAQFGLRTHTKGVVHSVHSGAPGCSQTFGPSVSQKAW
jgi:hypothetical protein